MKSLLLVLFISHSVFATDYSGRLAAQEGGDRGSPAQDASVGVTDDATQSSADGPSAVTTPESGAAHTPTPAPVSLPVVTVYATSGNWCAACNLVKGWGDDGDLPFTVSYVYDDPNHQTIPYIEWHDENGKRWWFDQTLVPSKASVISSWKQTQVAETKALAVDDAAPTPYAAVIHGLALLPKPAVAFVDFGCGADARWCVAAVEKWDCKAYGIEIDPARAAAARQHVAELGLSDRIEIIEGDSTLVDVDADVGVAYLYPQTLEALRPKLEKLTAFVSYMHQVPGLSMSKSDDSFVWRKPQPVQYATNRTAYYQGYTYQYGYRGCGNPNCEMCNSILRQLYGQ